MAEAPQFVLYEHAVGYALFRVKEFEEIGQAIPEVEAAVADVGKFGAVVKMHAFDPFKNTEAALDNCNSISEGVLHADLINFLEQNLAKEKKKKTTLGVGDSKLASSLSESVPHVKCQFSGVVPELLRGIRMHFDKLAKNLQHHSLSKAQLSLGHSYSRGKVKFDVHRVDNMVIQSIALLDQLDKDANTFGMRIREWYSYHFPELFRIVPDQRAYVTCALVIIDRKTINDETLDKLTAVLDDATKAAEIIEAARTSMGMDISPMDLINIERFAHRVVGLYDYRQRLHAYIKDRMHSCAPSLAALIGEQVGARLISHAGSLTNLAKYPASTVQILGAEKALFRALKTRTNTPKYGLLFHSTFIGRASMKNKGRISRFLANKCSIASRIDCFADVPVASFGEHLRQQVEDRLKYFESGDIPKKNLIVMQEAAVDAQVEQRKVLKKRKRAAKKLMESENGAAAAADENESTTMVVVKTESTRKSKRKHAGIEETTEVKEMETMVVMETDDTDAVKKKKKKSKRAKQ